MADFFTKTIAKTARELQTDPKIGLSLNEVQKRQEQYGQNKIQEDKPPSAIATFFKQVNNVFTYILLAAAIVSLALNEIVDMWVILAVLFLNIFVGFIQESKAQKTIRALKKIVVVTAKVVRNGKILVVPSEELVPGDIILIDSGDKVPADARLIESMDLKINESPLTGESMPSEKKAKAVLREGAPLADRDNMAYMGTIAILGKGKAIVTRIGLATEVGKIAGLVKKAEEEATPLQSRMKKLSLQIATYTLIALFLLVVLGISLGKDPVEIFFFAVAIAVAAIPEGLILAVTVILALGMRKILKQKALVRELLAAETLGSVSTICTDKTGTITTGDMSLEKIVTADGSYYSNDFTKEELIQEDSSKKNSSGKDSTFNPAPSSLNQTFKIGMLCNDLHFESTEGNPEEWKLLGDPTEKALVIAAGKRGFDRNKLTDKLEEVDEIPFDSYLKYMAAAFKNKETGNVEIYVKGSAEQLLARSTKVYKNGKIEELTDAEKQKFLKMSEKMSNEAYRVISAGYKIIPKQSSSVNANSSLKNFNLKEEIKESLIFAGLAGIKDPIRKGVKEAVKLCMSAGVNVKIITGDHKLTARTIAKEIGISASEDEILSGEEMDQMETEELENAIPKTKIFARVAPKHKLNIVDSLQRQEQIVAMTGDGVNDAPALKAADIGIAMGTGTEFAKETSEMILLDNNFKTIEHSIEEGRSIFDNIRKVITYLLTDSFSELILIGAALLAGLPLPILPVQILWVNLVGDGFPNFALAFEPKEKDVMNYPPRKKEEPLLNTRMKFLIFLIGIITDIILLGLFIFLWNKTHDISYTRTMIFAALGTDSLFYVFSCKSLRHPIWKTKPFQNKPLIFAVLFGFATLMLAVYLPFFQNSLSTVSLSLKDWLIIISLGILEIIVIETTKFIFTAKEKKKTSIWNPRTAV